MSDEGEFVVYATREGDLVISDPDGSQEFYLGATATYAEITAAIATLKEDEDV